MLEYWEVTRVWSALKFGVSVKQKLFVCDIKSRRTIYSLDELAPSTLGTLSTPSTPNFLLYFLKELGETPNSSLKTRLNHAGSLKPQA